MIGTFLNEFECSLLELFAGERFSDGSKRDNLLLLLLFLLLLAPDAQDAVRELDVDVALGHAGQLGGDLVGLLLLDDVDGRGLPPADLAASERLDVEQGTAERRPEGAPLEILEQAIDFSPEALEWPPLDRTIGFLGLYRYCHDVFSS